mgnify:CR=1 FL=1
MNIVFEGITGTGKTTLINRIYTRMIENNLNVYKISEIDNVSPLSPVLERMYQTDTFLRMKKNISTIISESLILAADYQYMNEYTKKLSGYKLFDRDLFTEIVYQKYFLELEYGKNNKFYKNWEKCLLYNRKKIDKVIYIEAPLSLCIKRNEARDNREFSSQDVEILEKLSLLQKEYVINYCNKEKIDLLFIDGSLNINDNIEIVYNFIINNQTVNKNLLCQQSEKNNFN